MTEQEYLTSNDPQKMLLHLQVGNLTRDSNPISFRKLRLFACGCCQRVWDGVVCPTCKGTKEVPATTTRKTKRKRACGPCHGTGRIGGLTDPRSRAAVEVAERYADGEATETERAEAEHEASNVLNEWPVWYAVCRTPCFGYGNWFLDPTERLIEFPNLATQAALLRDICGNPWRPSPIATVGPPSWREWNNGTVPALARAIYNERSWWKMPILGDALEDAGCQDADILQHCRGKCLRCGGEGTEHKGGANRCSVCGGREAVHARGCWVLDLLLGK